MKFLAAVVAALAFPAAAWGEATLVTRELPVGGQRTLASVAAPERFNMVGLHWRGPGRVQFRVRTTSGRWTRWRDARGEPDDLPDRGTDEARRREGWRIGSPWWTGTANRLDVRVRGVVRRLRAHYVWSPEEPSLERSLQMAGSPKIVSRRAWGANEAIRRKKPDYAPRLTAAIVHHTAGAAPASPAQSAAIVRGVYAYHVRGNGWDDIGYNFLVDRFGQVFEGRYGGLERNAIGAHALGFNKGSVGVALLGRYDGTQVSPAARNALVQLLAWRMDVAHVNPVSNTSFVSAGNPKYRKGAPIWLRAVSGHRDTGYTSCPGSLLYGQLRTVARSAAALGLPKLYLPEVEGSLGQFVSFSAELSAPLPWTVTVTDPSGKAVATGTGFGTDVQWTWDSRFATAAGYRWRISAGPEVRPAAGALGTSVAAAVIEGLSAEPAGFTPNGDMRTDSTTISYDLASAASVRVDLQTDQGAPLTTLQTGSRPAGRHTVAWNGEGYPDGRYRVAVIARAGGREATATTNVVLSRTLSGFGISPAAISPNGDGRSDGLTASFNLALPALARLTVRRGATDAAAIFEGFLPAGPHAIPWSGRPRDGLYTVALTITESVGAVTQTTPLRVDRVAPRISIVTRRPLRISIAEPARVTFVADGAMTTLARGKAGAFRVVLDRPFASLEAYAEDLAGNVGPRLRLR
ncbi:MAG: N-acetylmuramoyl-L-alanine amidase [Actinobacteria bacterium]|nr:N-acetylmuramoyl-L-alanine amidase [Actinomycetota bacterium]